MSSDKKDTLGSRGSRFGRAVSRAKIRIRTRSPFFGTLLFHTEVHPDPYLRTAATDGQNVFVSPDFMEELSPAQLDGLLLHEVLHAALRHVSRRGLRTPIRWNVAADIVVNGILRTQPWAELPGEAVVDPNLEERSAEEIYELLPEEDEISRRVASPIRWHKMWGDLQKGSPPKRSPTLESYWRRALRRAQAAARTLPAGQNRLPAGLKRLVEAAASPRIDWRQVLWRFLARTPTDFSDYDRRFVHRGLYLETLQTQNVRAYVAVDTSGSVTDEQLSGFLAEVRAIGKAYPHTEMQLYYADAALHGPYPLRSGEPPVPKGGGGTSFVPFFERLRRETDPFEEAVAIYLTDGYGIFPEKAPPIDVLWAVVPGGLENESFPFGKVLRLLGHESN